MRVGSGAERRGLLLLLRRLLSRWSQRGARRWTGRSLHRDDWERRVRMQLHSLTHSLTDRSPRLKKEEKQDEIASELA